MMIAGNYSNNFRYVPEWLWDKHISPTEFLLYMALRSFSYPTGPTIEMLAAKTGFDSAVVEETVRSLHGAGLAEPCLTDEYGEPCNDRWVFTYLKYTQNAPDRAPVPAPDDLTMAEMLRQHEMLSERRMREYYAAHPEAEEADKRRREANAVQDALDRERIEQQSHNLVDPNYLRSPGPINPDILGMVDEIKYMYYAAGERLAEMHYKLAELTGLALLDPDANWDLQNTLVKLWEIIYHGTLSNVRDDDNANDIYFEEFDNTYSDGREILTKIRVESEMDSEGALDFNRFTHGDGAIEDFPRGSTTSIRSLLPRKRTDHAELGPSDPVQTLRQEPGGRRGRAMYTVRGRVGLYRPGRRHQAATWDRQRRKSPGDPVRSHVAERPIPHSPESRLTRSGTLQPCWRLALARIRRWSSACSATPAPQ